MAVRVVSDSACDLPPETCEALGIEIVPLTIRFGDDEYVDRKELSTEDFWRKLESAPVLPETAAPSVGAFEETFRNLHEGGADGIVCVNLSAALSATMQSAQVAAKALDGLCPIEIIDSASASMGIGILTLHAARRAAEGADVFLSIGTSAVVYPAASLPLIAKRAGAYIVEINPEPTPLTPAADEFLQGPSGVILPLLAEAMEGARSPGR